jgi:hypothetical protein
MIMHVTEAMAMSRPHKTIQNVRKRPLKTPTGSMSNGHIISVRIVLAVANMTAALRWLGGMFVSPSLLSLLAESPFRTALRTLFHSNGSFSCVQHDKPAATTGDSTSDATFAANVASILVKVSELHRPYTMYALTNHDITPPTCPDTTPAAAPSDEQVVLVTANMTIITTELVKIPRMRCSVDAGAA